MRKERRKPRTLLMNVIGECKVGTKYEVVRYVGKRLLGWRLVRTDDDDGWDVTWTDSAVSSDRLARMRPYQRINHFPGMHAIARKNQLAINLNRIRKQYPKEYNFYPKTWVLPTEFADLSAQVAKTQKIIIVKPDSSC